MSNSKLSKIVDGVLLVWPEALWMLVAVFLGVALIVKSVTGTYAENSKIPTGVTTSQDSE